MTDRERVARAICLAYKGNWSFGEDPKRYENENWIRFTVLADAALSAMPTWRRIPGEVRDGEAPFDGRPVELWHTAINCRLIDQLWHPRARMFVQEEGACTKLSEVSWWMPSPPLPAPPAGEVG